MIIQETLTYIIVAAASIYSIYQFAMIFVANKSKPGGCCECSGDCSAKELK